MKSIFHMLIFCVLTISSNAQVESSSYIRLINANDSLRQVKNLGTPSNDSSGINAATFVNGGLYFGEANTSLIQLDFIPDYTYLASGVYFNIQFNVSNDSLLLIQVDQLPPVQVLNFDLQPLDSGAISVGEYISVVYNGSNFIVINPPKDKCPSGFLKVNERYCIEQNEHPALQFFPSVNYCSNLGYELCGFNDWFQACYTVPSLNNMTDNYEWVNNASNSGTQYKLMGMDSGGLTGCDKSYTIGAGSSMAFRCCYYLKK